MRYFIKSTRHIAISTIGAGRLVYQADSTSIYILPASLAQAQFFGSVSGLFFPMVASLRKHRNHVRFARHLLGPCTE